MLGCMGRLALSPPPTTPHQNRASMRVEEEKENRVRKDVVKKQKEKDDV